MKVNLQSLSTFACSLCNPKIGSVDLWIVNLNIFVPWPIEVGT
jgi:hypothetical protein